VLGIYSVIAFSVALRLQEIAIRIALGSQRSGIVGMVVVSGAKLAAAGCVIGVLGAMAASRLLHAFLFGVSALDPLVLTLASTVVLLLALMATLLPARRAASVDPVQALRAECWHFPQEPAGGSSSSGRLSLPRSHLFSC
jgi:putative ABC transport system permease protein